MRSTETRTKTRTRTKTETRTKSSLLLIIAMTLVMAFGVLPLQPARAAEVPVLDPGISQISSANALIGVPGTYENANADKLIARINEIRKEAYNEGLATSYVPIKWSDALEFIAQIRSVEASVNESHVRPKGGYVFNMNVNGVSSYAENLAWGVKALGAVELWYEEKADLVGKTGNETGHYESLIDPKNTYIGIGSFQAKGNWNSVCAEFTSGSSISENRTGISGACIQLIEIPKSDLTMKVAGDDTISVNNTITLTPKAGYQGMNLVWPEAKWTSSDESIATVSEDGTVTGIAPGEADLTAELCYYGIDSGMTATKHVTVMDRILQTPALGKVTPSKAAFTAKWKKPADQITGYQLQYSLKKTFKTATTITIKKPATLKKKVAGLKSGKTYFVRVRAFDNSGTTELTSEWSKARKVRVR